jgi:hypothetical protein
MVWYIQADLSNSFFRFENTRIFMFLSSSLGTNYEDMERYFEKRKEVFLKKNIIYKNLPDFLHRCHGLGDTNKYL